MKDYLATFNNGRVLKMSYYSIKEADTHAKEYAEENKLIHIRTKEVEDD